VIDVLPVSAFNLGSSGELPALAGCGARRLPGGGAGHVRMPKENLAIW